MTGDVPRILVVDDEISMREFLEMLLVREEYRVSCAENGKTAIRMLEKNRYDLLLCEWHNNENITG